MPLLYSGGEEWGIKASLLRSVTLSGYNQVMCDAVECSACCKQFPSWDFYRDEHRDVLFGRASNHSIIAGVDFL
jgi:hypothetical protein